MFRVVPISGVQVSSFIIYSHFSFRITSQSFHICQIFKLLFNSFVILNHLWSSSEWCEIFYGFTEVSHGILSILTFFETVNREFLHKDSFDYDYMMIFLIKSSRFSWISLSSWYIISFVDIWNLYGKLLPPYHMVQTILTYQLVWTTDRINRNISKSQRIV